MKGFKNPSWLKVLQEYRLLMHPFLLYNPRNVLNLSNNPGICTGA
jgi:hypothetical protein